MVELKNIMNKNQIYDFGIMSFSDIPFFIECRAKSRLPQNAQSVIVCLFPYNVGKLENRNVCRYATVMDYHTYINKVLLKVCEELKTVYNKSFECFVDSSPIPEVFCAVRAGLGFRGKNNLLITKKYGSYVFIGEIVTDMEFPLSVPNKESCMNCRLCIKNCPNGAIGESGIDYSKCVSNISQKKGELSSDEIEAIKRVGYAWGCDCCQDICPHNKSVQKTYINEFLQDVEPVLTVENIDKLIKTRSYGFRGKKVPLRNLEIIKKK